MICPRCSVADISAASGACELCGFVPEGNVAVDIPQPDATDQLAREQLAHEFRLDVLLGHGEHSAVFLAREDNSETYVVLKVMPRSRNRDPQADERFRKAAELIATLDHPHIVAINRHGSTDSLFWYTMDHVRARSLREILRSRGPLDLKTVQRLVAQIASALDYAHRRGVVHGALKPENILIDPNGWVHVCDPMISRALERPPNAQPMRQGPAPRVSPPEVFLPRPLGGDPRRVAPGGDRPSPPSGSRAAPGAQDRPSQPSAETPQRRTPAPAERSSPGGTDARGSDPVKGNEKRRPDYAAPEDLHTGYRTAFTDQFALAVLVHECLTGSPPSAGSGPFDPPATLASLRPDLPAHVTHAVLRAVSPKPAARYPSVLDFAMALETGTLALTDSHPTGRATDLVLTVPGWKAPAPRIPRWVWMIGGVALLALVGFLVVQQYTKWRVDRQWEQRPVGAAPAQGAAVADSLALHAQQDSLAVRAGSLTTRAPQPAPTRPRRTRPSDDDSAPPAQRPARRRASDAAAAPAPAPAPPPAATGEQGRLFVNASPWGQVFIDGTPVGNTPRANLQVPPGSHTIRVTRDGFEPFERTIQVGAGETVRITDIVLTPRP